MSDTSKRGPNRLGLRQGIHGGCIGDGDRPPDRAAADSAARWRKIIGSTPARERETQRETQRQAEQRDEAEVNALEAALSRTPHGRQLLDLLADAAKWRIHEALAGELVSCAGEQLERLRRELLSTRDPLEQQRAAAQIPEAERELLKWQRARADYQHRREYVEAALHNGMRALA